MKKITSIYCLAMLCLIGNSCKKYQQIGDAAFSDQLVYIPAAVEGNSANGLYLINKVAVLGQVFRYDADVAANKLNIPLSVYRSGVNTNGSVAVSLSINNDTVNKLNLAGKLPLATELLPASRYSFPSTLTVDDGSGFTNFDLSLDLNFLLANPTKKFAVAIGVSSEERGKGNFHTVIVVIDPAFLIPAANFTTTITGRTVTFANTSTNANAWSWNYGNGSPVSTLAAASYTYPAAGTYTITLTARGALGTSNPSTFSRIVVIP